MAEYTLTEREFVSAMFSAQRKRLIISLPAQLLMLLIPAIYLASSGKFHVAIYFAIGAIIIPFISIAQFKKTLKTTYKEHDDFHHVQHYDFSDTGFTNKTENSFTKVPWEKVVKWGENNNFFWFCQRDSFMWIVAKRALSETEFALVYRSLKGCKKI